MTTASTSGPQEQVNLPAVDLRRMYGGLISSEGIATSTDLAVSQRGAGANMSVDVAAGQAYIRDDHTGGGGYYTAAWTAVENVAIPAAHATLPRIDRVCVRVRDNYYADGANDITLYVVQGTATSGATLTNLTGVGTVPGSSLLLANVLVDAAASSIVTAKIQNVASAFVTAGRTTYRKTTAKLVNTSTTETDLLNSEITVGAGVLGTDRVLRLTAWGDWKHNTGGFDTTLPRFKLKLGGTTLFDSGAPGGGNLAADSSTRYPWRVRAEIANLASAAAQMVEAEGAIQYSFNGPPSGAITTGEGTWYGLGSSGGGFMGYNTGTVDTTVAAALVLSVILPVSNANEEIVLKGALVVIE